MLFWFSYWYWCVCVCANDSLFSYKKYDIPSFIVCSCRFVCVCVCLLEQEKETVPLRAWMWGSFKFFKPTKPYTYSIGNVQKVFSPYKGIYILNIYFYRVLLKHFTFFHSLLIFALFLSSKALISNFRFQRMMIVIAKKETFIMLKCGLWKQTGKCGMACAVWWTWFIFKTHSLGMPFVVKKWDIWYTH